MSKLSSMRSELPLNNKRIEIVASHLAPHLAQCFGYHALLYSPVAKQICGDELCIKKQVIIGETGSDVTVKCRFQELPIASDCIDLAMLPSILESSINPHQVLRELERVLIPEGVVIIIGRNPFSWQGIVHRIKVYRENPKSVLRDINRRRLSDWFRLLGFEKETEISISITNEKLQHSKSYWWVKRLGQIFCDYFCSHYIIIARKKVSTLTPIRPSWRRNKQLVPSRLAEPSVRSQVESWFEQFK